MPKWIRKRERKRGRPSTQAGRKRRGTRLWRRGRRDEGVVCALSAENQSRISDAQPVATCETRSIGSRWHIDRTSAGYSASWNHAFADVEFDEERSEMSDERRDASVTKRDRTRSEGRRGNDISTRCACGRIRNTFASKVDGCFFARALDDLLSRRQYDL